MVDKITRREFIKSGINLCASVGVSSLGISDYVQRLVSEKDGTEPTSTVIKSEPLINRRQLNQEQQQFIVDHAIVKGDTTLPKIIMTYDDWPYTPDQLSQILDAYKGLGSATFFILGDRLNYLADGKLKDYGWNNNDIIKRIADEGHEIGCHGWQHDTPMTQLKDSTLSLQFEQWFEAFHKILPNQEVLHFRAPFGAEDLRVKKIAARYGLQHVLWNVESGGQTNQTYNNVVDGVTENGFGTIVLSHLQRDYDVRYASKIVSYLVQSGMLLDNVTNGINSKDRLNI